MWSASTRASSNDDSAPQLDEDVADAPAGGALDLERFVELLVGDEPAFDQRGADATEPLGAHRARSTALSSRLVRHLGLGLGDDFGVELVDLLLGSTNRPPARGSLRARRLGRRELDERLRREDTAPVRRSTSGSAIASGSTTASRVEIASTPAPASTNGSGSSLDEDRLNFVIVVRFDDRLRARRRPRPRRARRLPGSRPANRRRSTRPTRRARRSPRR